MEGLAPGLTVVDPEQSIDAEIASLMHDAATSDQGAGGARGFMEPKAASKKKNGRHKKECGCPGCVSKYGNAPDPSYGGGRTEPFAGPTDQASGGGLTPEQVAVTGENFKKGCKGIFDALSGALVRSTGLPQVALLPDETKALGDAWGDVCIAYAPQVISKHGALIVACGITASVGMRVKQTIDEEISRRQKIQATHSGPATVDEAQGMVVQ